LADLQRPEKQFVTFIARTPYDQPLGRVVRRFEVDSIQDWFRKYWQCGDSTEQVFRAFLPLVEGVLKGNQDVRLNHNDFVASLKSALESCLHCNRLHVTEHAIEIISDDDEQTVLFYWFDSKFLAENRDKFSYLVREDLLPTRVDHSHLANSKKFTYVCSCYPDDSADTENWDILKITGKRLDQIGDAVPLVSSESLLELFEPFDHKMPWKHFFANVISGEPHSDKSIFQCTAHICEFYHHFDIFQFSNRSVNVIRKIIVFDDVWFFSHPALAKSVIALEKDRLISEEEE